jgi:hypothetical protein
MSPFYVDADPDPNSAPIHPYSHDLTPKKTFLSRALQTPQIRQSSTSLLPSLYSLISLSVL